jgi:glutamate-1-semialdehyde 2,1-aminomutase
VREAIAGGVACSLNCPEEVELAELLCELHPWAEQVRFSRGGGEAMAMAVRIARAKTGRSKIAFCGYHGWHDWYLAANLQQEGALDAHLIGGLAPNGVPRELAGTAVPFRMNSEEEFSRAISCCGDDLAAVVMEPLRNVPPGEEFMRMVRRTVDRAGAVLIIDEISAGLRFNTGGAHLVMHPVEPDIAVFSKALGNGYNISAVIGRRSVMDAAQSSFISSTNWTDRVGPTAALATLKKHSQLRVYEHLVGLGDIVQKGWVEAAEIAGLPIEVSGMKPISHFKIPVSEWAYVKAYFIQEMLEKGFLASSLFYSMYAHSLDDVHQYLEEIRDVFIRVSGKLSEGSLHECIKGEPSMMGFERLN